MAKRRFKLDFSVHGEFVDSAVIELDNAVIEAVDDEWRAIFYDLHMPEEIAIHIGYNLIVNHWSLSSLDGWADQPDENARVISWPGLHEAWDIEAREAVEAGR